MPENELLETNVKFCYTINQLTIQNIINILNRDTVVYSNNEETPIKTSVLKLMKGLPINVTMICERFEGKLRYTIIKGESEIKNLLRWINEDISIEIQENNVSFKTFNDKTKEYILERKYGITLTTISQRLEPNESPLLIDDLIKIVQTYY